MSVGLSNGIKAARVTLEPGWRWTECIRPVVGTERCQARHIGAVVAPFVAMEFETITAATYGKSGFKQ